MTVKESFNLAGLPTTFGNPMWKDNVPTANAVVVDRLEAAGAVIFGKTNVPFMLADSQSYNDIYGTTNNPGSRLRSRWLVGRRGHDIGGGMSALGAGGDRRLSRNQRPQRARRFI